MAVTKTGITQLKLTNFRSYDFLDLNIGDHFCPILISGHNGAGKTNILEAISLLTAGKGLRSAKLSDVARHVGENVYPLWSISAKVASPLGTSKIGTGMVAGSERRQVRIDGKTTTKQSDLARVFRCLWLTPAQDRLFCGDPSARRRFLDRIVQTFDPNHANRLTDYNAALKEWNTLVRTGAADSTWLDALEQQLVENGIAISASRLDVVERISKYLSITDNPTFPAAEIQLTGVLEKALLSQSAVMVEDAFMGNLKTARKICAEGGNLTGPHTADFIVIHKQQNRSADLCSTGEQKALLLSIILAEMQAQMAEQGHCPLLLLDEVSAHLDEHRQHTLFEVLLSRPTQVWMTSTNSKLFADFTGLFYQFDVQESIVKTLVA
ncbi:MAG: DNA replication/repair protein RecF [Alphaproteobacteria bacterium]|nr:DNA replication/repair protein RecF [Alphaproteobacteria bacterium]